MNSTVPDGVPGGTVNSNNDDDGGFAAWTADGDSTAAPSFCAPGLSARQRAWVVRTADSVILSGHAGSCAVVAG